MTPTTAIAHALLAATKSGSNPIITLLPLLLIGVAGYFFFIRPQQRKAQAARAAQGSEIEVGDEVQTVGGVIGTVLEIHGDRYTVLTGALSDDGNLDGPQPTRIVFVRQAIARKVERLEPPADAAPGSAASAGGSIVGKDAGSVHDIQHDDVHREAKEEPGEADTA
jgi:preprotein translocase YajC subunit